MYQIRVIISFFFLLSLKQAALAQKSEQVSNFTNKIETMLTTISNDHDLRSYKIISARRIIIKGSFDNGRKRFSQVIVIYKSGIKKEKTKIYGVSLGLKFQIANIIRINDKLFFAKYYQTQLKGRNRYERIFVETLFDQKWYVKEDY